MNVTAYWMAERYIGHREIPGKVHDPTIMSWLTLDNDWPENDETHWCSAFVNAICWQLRLPRSKSLRARSWLSLGIPIPFSELGYAQGPKAGWDIVVLNRAKGSEDPTKDGPGHVGFYAGYTAPRVFLLGGNQADQVSVAPYPANKILGIRRLREE